MKRLIIAGSRDLVCRLHCVTVANASERFVAAHWMPDIVLSGACRGADELGEHWAKTVGIPIEKYPADWSQERRAGPLRNALWTSPTVLLSCEDVAHEARRTCSIGRNGVAFLSWMSC